MKLAKICHQLWSGWGNRSGVEYDVGREHSANHYLQVRDREQEISVLRIVVALRCSASGVVLIFDS